MRLRVPLLFVFLMSMLGSAIAQEPAPPAPDTASAIPATAVPAVAAPLTEADVEAWLDGFLPYALQTADIAGAVVVVVKDGQILAEKGYGYADVAAKKPVDPQTTLFRPGSVSKLFTWTAVMQLVEQGKLDLDTDVNKYLDFEVPPRDGKPITLRNIMTHTAGFEEQFKGLMSTAVEGKPLATYEDYLKVWVPTRIFAPGTTPAYSNYATSMAGYIVERVSDTPYDDYIEQHIFKPLGMEHATFRQPLPEQFKLDMAKGYAVASQPDKPYEIVGPAPAGSLAASGTDMARFMIAHLQNGEFGGQRILEQATAEKMHDTALTLLPSVHRMLLGFYEENRNGHRIIGHAGDLQWFHSDLHLFINDGVGFFVSFNSAGKNGGAGQIRTALFEAFADRYMPGPEVPPAGENQVDAKTAAEHAQMMVGTYDGSRRSDSSFFRLLSLAGPTKVAVNADGTLNVPMARNLAGVPIKWHEIEPFVWRDVDGQTLLAAQVENGRVARFTFGMASPFMTFVRAPISTSPAWMTPALIIGLTALLLTVLAWPISALVRRRYRVTYQLAGIDARAHRWIRIDATSVVAVFIDWAAIVAKMMSNLNLMTSGMGGWLWMLKLISIVVFIGAAAIGVWNAMVVVRSTRKWYAKVWAVVLALALIVALWVAFAVHLLALNIDY